MTNQEIAEEFEMTLDELSEVNQLPNEIKRFINDLRESHGSANYDQTDEKLRQLLRIANNLPTEQPQRDKIIEHIHYLIGLNNEKINFFDL